MTKIEMKKFFSSNGAHFTLTTGIYRNPYAVPLLVVLNSMSFGTLMKSSGTSIVTSRMTFDSPLTLSNSTMVGNRFPSPAMV